MTNEDIKKIWIEKNKQILANKLTIDAENNSNSLELSTYNIIKKIIYNLYNEVKNILDDQDIDYNNKDLKKIFRTSFNELKKIIHKEINNRLKLINKAIKKGKLDEELLSLSNTFKDNLKNSMYIEIDNLNKNIKDNYNISNVDLLFNSKKEAIIDNIIDEESIRTNNLKNFYTESIKHYENMINKNEDLL